MCILGFSSILMLSAGSSIEEMSHDNQRDGIQGIADEHGHVRGDRGQDQEGQPGRQDKREEHRVLCSSAAQGRQGVSRPPEEQRFGSAKHGRPDQEVQEVAKHQSWPSRLESKL